MKIVISDKVKSFLTERKIKCITVNAAKASLCCGNASMPNIEHIKPEVISEYDYFRVSEIDIYISKFLTTEDELNFVLKSFTLLKYVDVQGIKLI